MEWPTLERGQALVSVLLEPQGAIAAGPWAGLPNPGPALVVTDDQQWLISEYDQTFEALQLEPPMLPLSKVRTASAGLILGVQTGLPPPARSWKSAAADGGFVEEAPAKLPAALREVWARDLACPHFESHLAPLPSPIRILLPLDGHSALGISQDGRHYRISPSQVTPLVVEGWPGGRAGFGVHLGAAKVALSTFEGAVVRGTITDRTVRYEAPVRPFTGEPFAEIRALTGAADGEPLVVTGLYGAIAIIRAQTSTVVHYLAGGAVKVEHHRLAWTEEGEVLGLYRGDLDQKGVWRLTFEPTPRVTTEVFGTSALDTPNEIARVQGEWTIAGAHADLRDQQGLFRNHGRGWEKFASFLATFRVEGLADAPAWDGVVFSTRNGARVGAQARPGLGRPCAEVEYRPQQNGGGDVIGTIALADGRVIAALENLEEVLILRPHRPWIGD